MSHTTTHKEKITDKNLFLDVCKNRGYQVTDKTGSVKLFGSNQVIAVASIEIPGWRYPVALTEDGKLQYDHFGSEPGTMELLGEALQQYNEIATMKEVPFELIANHWIEELPNGDRQLILEYN